jgi:hypothetical protein
VPKITAKKKCCRDKSLCAKCPLTLMHLVKMGYAQKCGGTCFKVSGKVPKKVLLVARSR